MGQKTIVKTVGSVKGLLGSTCAERYTVRHGWLLVCGSSQIPYIGFQGVKLASDRSCGAVGKTGAVFPPSLDTFLHCVH